MYKRYQKWYCIKLCYTHVIKGLYIDQQHIIMAFAWQRVKYSLSIDNKHNDTAKEVHKNDNQVAIKFGFRKGEKIIWTGR